MQMTRGVAYRCPECGKSSYVRTWQLRVVGAIGGGFMVGLGLPLIRAVGWSSFMLLLGVAAVLMTFGVMHFCQFNPTQVEE